MKAITSIYIDLDTLEQGVKLPRGAEFLAVDETSDGVSAQVFLAVDPSAQEITIVLQFVRPGQMLPEGASYLASLKSKDGHYMLYELIA